MGAKVLAKRNIIYVHEDRILAIMDGEAISNTARHHIGIGTAIGDRDLWHWSPGRTVVLTVPRDEIDSDPILRILRPILRSAGWWPDQVMIRSGHDELRAGQAAVRVETSAGRWLRYGVAFSKASATPNRIGSWNGLPTSWTATGRPPAPKPAQTEIAG